MIACPSACEVEGRWTSDLRLECLDDGAPSHESTAPFIELRNVYALVVGRSYLPVHGIGRAQSLGVPSGRGPEVHRRLGDILETEEGLQLIC
jgi:hypothetical protein